MEVSMSEEIKIDITCQLEKHQQELICEYVSDYLEENEIEWKDCSYTLIAEYTPDKERQE
jgi:hypothetical protein